MKLQVHGLESAAGKSDEFLCAPIWENSHRRPSMEQSDFSVVEMWLPIALGASSLRELYSIGNSFLFIYIVTRYGLSQSYSGKFWTKLTGKKIIDDGVP